MRSGTISSSRRFTGAAAPLLTLAVLLSIVTFTFAVNDPVAAAEPAAVTQLTMTEVVPVRVSGTVLGLAEGGIVVQEPAGAGPVAFPVALGLVVTRNGAAAPVDALQAGDKIGMTIDGRTGSVLRADAQAVSAPMPFAPSGEAALLASLGLIGGGAALATRHRTAPARIVPSRPAFAPVPARG
jgi:hypothetical protein